MGSTAVGYNGPGPRRERAVKVVPRLRVEAPVVSKLQPTRSCDVLNRTTSLLCSALHCITTACLLCLLTKPNIPLRTGLALMRWRMRYKATGLG